MNLRHIVVILLAACVLEARSPLAASSWMLLSLSFLMLSLLFANVSRLQELAHVLDVGWKRHVHRRTGDSELELRSVERLSRIFLFTVAGFSLAYWFAVSDWIGGALARAGALLYAVDFVLSLELLEYLAANPAHRHSQAVTRRVIAGGYALLACQSILLTVAVLRVLAA